MDYVIFFSTLAYYACGWVSEAPIYVLKPTFYPYVVILRILDGIAWDFAQAKWWRWWKTVRCGCSILSYCPRNPHGKAGNEERRKKKKNIFCLLRVCHKSLYLVICVFLASFIFIFANKKCVTALIMLPRRILANCTHLFTIYCFFIFWVKYGTLTFWLRRLCGVVVRARVCQVSRSNSICATFFYTFSSEPCIRVRVGAAMPAYEVANRSRKRGYTLKLCCPEWRAKRWPKQKWYIGDHCFKWNVPVFIKPVKFRQLLHNQFRPNTQKASQFCACRNCKLQCKAF